MPTSSYIDNHYCGTLSPAYDCIGIRSLDFIEYSENILTAARDYLTSVMTWNIGM